MSGLRVVAFTDGFGSQDLTFDVNFGDLVAMGREAVRIRNGANLSTQRGFLERFGLEQGMHDGRGTGRGCISGAGAAETCLLRLVLCQGLKASLQRSGVNAPNNDAGQPAD